MLKHFDYHLLISVVVLLILGIVVLASVSGIYSQENFGKTTYYFFHQLIFGLIPGIIGGFVAFRMPLTFFKKWSWLFVLINLFLMVLVFIPGIGIVSGGAPRWLNLRFVSFQPSEFLKISFIIYLSAWLMNRVKEKKHSSSLVPFLFIIGFIVLLLTCQSDASTMGIIFLIGGLMYFSANTPFWHNILIFGMGMGIVMLLIKFAPYRLERILVFLKPDTDPMGLGYQLKQALITIGSGGIFGLGLGASQQRFGFLPQTMSDSIFAIFSEETGFVGAFILILIFLIFLWRGLRIAKSVDDNFSQFFAIGFTCWICFQSFINIGSMLGLLPLTGIPLPFISYGGSHLIAELTGVGILLNISKSIKK